MCKKQCWNCEWFNGNRKPCDMNEIVVASDTACDNFKDDPNFPEKIGE